MPVLEPSNDEQKMKFMILIGQYDSPSSGASPSPCGSMACRSSTGRGRPSATPTRSRPINPLRRVPTLVLDDGEALIESAIILDHLDDGVGPDEAMIARAARRGGGTRGSARWRPASPTRGSACSTSACCARRSSSSCGSSAAKSQICGRARGAGKGARRGRRRIGSAKTSATPISRSVACCAFRRRASRRCSTRALPR